MTVRDDANELLFVYGTLLLERVQLAQFGRTVPGFDDVLPGYRLSTVSVEDPDVVAKSGETVHPVVVPTGRGTDEVNGRVLRITTEELRRADEYEVDDYKRVAANLRSGLRAWVYVEAGDG
jgi:gamma-glutamylcyclotransferase (GGCT)/AIG2-like uncharacterized protein YtfP